MADDALGQVTEGLLDGGGEIPLNLAQEFRYTIAYNVAVRVASKLRFQADTAIDPKKGETPIYLLHQCITDAESALDRKLSPRYVVPLAADYAEFTALDQLTQDAIRPLVDAFAASRLLAIAFGSTAPVKGDEYRDALKQEFDEGIAALLDRKQAPLPDLELLDTAMDDARGPSIFLDNRGAATGVHDVGSEPVHPVDTVLARLPRSDLERF